MNNKEDTNQKTHTSRRKFVWGVGVLSMFAAMAAAKLPFQRKREVIACKPESKKTMIKMLTQDGTLVEIDESLITANRKKVTNTELRDWIKK